MGAITEIIITLSLLSSAALLCLVLAVLAIRRAYFRNRSNARKCTLAFFHPYCNAGGGGERVLWCAIQALHGAPERSHFHMVVYSGDDIDAATLLSRAKERFGLDLPDDLSLEVIYVRGRGYLEATRYPRFTMLGQSWGSMVLAWECLRRYNPDVFVDTTGCHFSFLVAKLCAGCSVACYVHYPTITTDMLRRVWDRRPSYNNDAAVARSALASAAKFVYYSLFGVLYAFVGGFVDVVMVNSTWTKGHIDSLWHLPLAPDGASAASSSSASSLVRGASSSSSSSRSSSSSLTRRRPSLSSLSSAAAAAGAAFSSDAGVSLIRSVPALLARGLRITSNRPQSRLVFPPCNTDVFSSLPLLPHPPAATKSSAAVAAAAAGSASLRAASSDSPQSGYSSTSGRRSGDAYRDPIVISVGQFRPEKDHALQLRAFAEFLARGRRGQSQQTAAAAAAGLLVGTGVGRNSASERNRSTSATTSAKQNDGIITSTTTCGDGGAHNDAHDGADVSSSSSGGADAADAADNADGDDVPASVAPTTADDVTVGDGVGKRATLRRRMPLRSTRSSVEANGAATHAKTADSITGATSAAEAAAAAELDDADYTGRHGTTTSARPSPLLSAIIERGGTPGRGAFDHVRLVLVGGVRDEGDAARVDALRDLAVELGIADSVEFIINAPFPELLQLFGRARAGLHTMWNEHFGIGVVEMMAAGVITIAHNSGGPRADIVVPAIVPQPPQQQKLKLREGADPHSAVTSTTTVTAAATTTTATGFLACTPSEYAAALEAVFSVPPSALINMAERARAHVRVEFSDGRFSMGVFRALVPLIRAGLDDAKERRANVVGGERSGR